MGQRVPAHMLNRATLLEKAVPPMIRDSLRLADLERGGWRVRNRSLRESGVPVASTQGFRSIPSWMPQDPMDVNATQVAAAADTVLWNAALWSAIPANGVGGADVYKVTAAGVTTTAVTAGQTLIVNPRFGTAVGGTLLGASRTTPIAAIVQTNVPWFLEMWVHFRTRGASGTAVCWGHMMSPTILGPAGSAINPATLTFGTQATTATAVDTTAAAGLIVSVTPSLSTQTFTTLAVIPELLN